MAEPPLGAAPQFGVSQVWCLLVPLPAAGTQRWLGPQEAGPVAEGLAQMMTWAAGPAESLSPVVGLAQRGLHCAPVGNS